MEKLTPRLSELLLGRTVENIRLKNDESFTGVASFENIERMIRSTLYLAVSDGTDHDGSSMTELFSKIPTPSFLHFMHCFVEFCNDIVAEKTKVLMLSPMQGDFVNICDVRLLKTELSNDCACIVYCGLCVYQGKEGILYLGEKNPGTILRQWNDRVIGATGTFKTNDLDSINEKFVQVRDAQGVLISNVIAEGTLRVVIDHFFRRDCVLGCPLMHRLSWIQSTGTRLNFESTGTRLNFEYFMHYDGGINYYHAHVIPALFLNSIMQKIGSDRACAVQTYVMCMGTAVGESHPWVNSRWNGNGSVPQIFTDVMGALVGSERFKKLSDKMIRRFSGTGGKTIRRLFVWFCVKQHVISLCWEVVGSVSVCFIIDNLGEDYRFNGRIVEYLNAHFETDEFNAKFSAAGIQHMKVSGMGVKPDFEMADGMVCASYMARATLYLSMLSVPCFVNIEGNLIPSSLNQQAKQLSRITGFEVEETAFLTFLSVLVNFCKTETDNQRLVLISPVNDVFVAFEDIHILSVNSNDVCDERRYCYDGTRMSEVSVASVRANKPQDGCACSSEFILPYIRECVRLVDSMRLR